MYLCKQSLLKMENRKLNRITAKLLNVELTELVRLDEFKD